MCTQRSYMCLRVISTVLLCLLHSSVNREVISLKFPITLFIKTRDAFLSPLPSHVLSLPSFQNTHAVVFHLSSTSTKAQFASLCLHYLYSRVGVNLLHS